VSEPSLWQSGTPTRRSSGSGSGSGANLADILERVLDKGIVIAGDIQINLLDIELLTIKLRLLVASVDKAKEMGIDWWEHDPSLSSGAPRRDLSDENRELRERIAKLERQSEGQAALTDGSEGASEDDDADETDASDGKKKPAARSGTRKRTTRSSGESR